MKHRGTPMDLAAIRRVGLLTVEGENDDISGIGQTLAAQELCRGIPPSMKAHYQQDKVGHFGVFNGSRFRTGSCPASGNSMPRFKEVDGLFRKRTCSNFSVLSDSLPS